MKKLPVLFFTILIILSCQREESYVAPEGTIAYDIFPVMGQSNAYNGYGLDYTLDKTDDRIKQLGRFGANDHQIIAARDPLEHLTIADSCNGFAMTFAMNYLQNYWQRNREVLLIPAALNGSSFRYRQWNRGDTLYKDVIERIKYVLQKYPGSEVKGFLWHQGESDTYWGRDYAGKLDLMITYMRREVAGLKGDSIPFIVGGLVPYSTDKLNGYKIIDSVIRETPDRLPFIGYASARLPFVITKPDNTVNEGHFDAAGHRELGKRYFEAYKSFQR